MTTSVPFIENYSDLRAGLPGAGLPWLDTLRGTGLDRYEALGLPTPKVEDWKYTNLRALTALTFARASGDRSAAIDDVPSLVFDGDVHRIVLVNGTVNAALSDFDGLPDGLSVLPFDQAITRDPGALESHVGHVAALGRKPFVALNTAYLDDGLVIRVAAGAKIDAPLHLAFVGAAGDEHLVWHPRLLIVVEEGASATIVETHSGAGSYFSNGVSEVTVGRDGGLHHLKIQDEAAAAFHIAAIEARVSARASYESFILSTGAALSRNQISVLLAEEEARCRVNGAYLMRGNQHVDTTSVIDHAVPNCTTNEVYKGVLDDKARAVFQGKIIVRKDAQHTEGHQLNKTLLLSDRAEIDAKPELEIYADDVACGHGATTGEIDENALFYLRSRGIDAEIARSMLIDAFVDEALQEISREDLHDTFRATVAAWQKGGLS
ncbi:MAG: Fe-S cluster assembly protein SufD [Pseudomonadota bacterium]